MEGSKAHCNSNQPSTSWVIVPASGIVLSPSFSYATPAPEQPAGAVAILTVPPAPSSRVVLVPHAISLTSDTSLKPRAPLCHCNLSCAPTGDLLQATVISYPA